MISDIEIGKAGEHLVIADLLLKGYPAALAGWGAKYDIVVEAKGKILKIQVKSTIAMKKAVNYAKPIYRFAIWRTGKNGKKRYQRGDFDCYAFVAIDKKAVFYMPFEDAKAGTICIRDRDNVHVGHNGGCRPGIYLQDLTWEECLKKL